MNDSTEMFLIEGFNFKYSWECSVCKKEFKDTKKFLKSKSCPNCGKTIQKWIGPEDYQDDVETT